jgi:poly(A) polymerase
VREGVAPAQDLRAIPDADPPPLLPFSGKDIVAAGVAPGPRVSEILKEFETAWIEADFPNEARAKTLLAAVIAKALA